MDPCPDRTANPRGRLATMFLLVCIWAVFAVVRPTPWVDMSPDTGRYLALARSLQAGEGYRLDGRFCRFYPPGFPWLLSLIHSPAAGSYRAEKLLVAAAALGALLLSHLLLGERHPGRRLVALSVLMALSPTFVLLATAVRSEMPFFLLSSAFLLCATRFWRSERRDWRLAAGSAVTLALAAMTRSVALTFYAASLLWLLRPSLWRRDARRCLLFAGVLLAASLPLAAWQAEVHRHRDEGTISYDGFLRSFVLEGSPVLSAEGIQRLAARQLETAPRQLMGAAQMLVLSEASRRYAWVAFLLLPIMFTGLLQRLRRPELQDWCFCAYGLLVTLWPYAQETRFWLPMLPLVLAYLTDGVDVVAARWPHVAMVGAVTGSILLFTMAGTGSMAVAKENLELGEDAVRNVVLPREKRELLSFLDGVDGPAIVAYGGYVQVLPALGRPAHRAVSLPHNTAVPDDEVLRDFRDRGVTHVAFDKHIPSGRLLRGRAERIRGVVEGHPDRFRLVHDAAGMWVYEMRPAR